jgi:hypothetical protein
MPTRKYNNRKLGKAKVPVSWDGAVGDSLLIQKLIKRIKNRLKTCFFSLIIANIRGYCGESMVRLFPELSIIFLPFYETPLAQKHFIAHSRVIQTPTGAIRNSRA